MSTDLSTDEHLAVPLLRDEGLTADQLAEALKRAVERGHNLAQVLLEDGMLT